MDDAQAAMSKVHDILRVYRRMTQKEHEFVYGLSVRMPLMGIEEQERSTLEGIWARIGAGDCGRRD